MLFLTLPEKFLMPHWPLGCFVPSCSFLGTTPGPRAVPNVAVVQLSGAGMAFGKCLPANKFEPLTLF